MYGVGMASEPSCKSVSSSAAKGSSEKEASEVTHAEAVWNITLQIYPIISAAVHYMLIVASRIQLYQLVGIVYCNLRISTINIVYASCRSVEHNNNTNSFLSSAGDSAPTACHRWVSCLL